VILVQGLLSEVGATKRRALAKTITLLESTKPEHRAQADALLLALQQHPKPKTTFRLGISGVPGVGKSTFIEALGLAMIKEGQRVAVLAVDPSSSLSGGSILGTKREWSVCPFTSKPSFVQAPVGGT
jgi:LAO/AO transport system kinase